MSISQTENNMDCNEDSIPAIPLSQQDGNVLGAIESMKQALLKEMHDTRADVAGLSTKVDKYMGRLKQVEDQCKVLQQTVNANEQKQAKVNEDIRHTINATKSSISIDLEKTKERLDRMAKACNIIVKGIPEEDESDLFARLIEIILPKRDDLPKFIRIGEKSTENPTERPRFIKTFLSSANEKATALRNCKFLKGLPDFDAVSVQPDLTKKQLEERRKRHILTRSETNKRKEGRSLEGDDDVDGPPSKFARLESS